MAIRADVLEIARVLDLAAAAPRLDQFKTPETLGAEAKIYAELMTRLPRNADVPGALKGAGFQPHLLVNGLIVAASLRRPARSALLAGLAAGLREFADYFEGTNPSAQRRYFAFCAAQLIECGVPVTAAFATMKGDAADEASASEVRAWIEEGPGKMLSSPWLTDEERRLWRGVFDGGRAAWAPLRDHLVAAYALPLSPLPLRP